MNKKYCYSCGNVLNDNDAFCNVCGATQNMINQTQPVTGMQTQPVTGMQTQPVTGMQPQYNAVLPK